MKKISLLITFIAFCSCTASAQLKDKDVQAIRHLLDVQTKAWNTGNIEGFMKGYWENDSLLFIGKSGPKYGYNTTLENYKNSYPDATAMGKLHFDVLHVKRLSSLYFFVAGKWHLARTIGNLEGHFTLLFNKIKGQWVIVADHSS